MKINVEKIKLGNTNRLCVITDIHHIKHSNNKFYNSIVRVVKKEEPNYILIPGDIVDNPKILNTDYIEILICFFSELSKFAPVIISKGNHDIASKKYRIADFYKKLEKYNNIFVLDNISKVIGGYQFIGFSPVVNAYRRKYKSQWDEMFIEEFKKCNFKIIANKKNILLCHAPNIIIKKNIIEKLPIIKNIDYIICGHMHNGLVPKKLESILKNNGLFGPEYTLFPKYCRGVHKLKGKCNLIICKSLRSLTKNSVIFRTLDKLYSNNITIIDI